ncbi:MULTISPECIES: hypothetical protein [unclassified Nitrosospira]|jgi:hypothetical protein|uniref:hypothetical protein n=1 Tax=unclassified Nitrosospira TaxID=2609267 RepID=UPI000D302426|nr:MULTISPECIES: hypothetical protein [unclassified Nitrosospira]PTR13467.1 hypothetical protein C8R31_11132 [Nitrosospira sp. Nsp2]WON72955.1 hypothetical protein R5L00_10680 [Nitrosospira sp. Is2]
MSSELEQERNALLERMHASRNNYRSELVYTEEPRQTVTVDAFPRSQTFKFIARHPYSASLGLLAALAFLPRKPLRRAVKGGIALAAGMLGSSAKTLVMRQVLPSVVSSLKSRNQMK